MYIGKNNIYIYPGDVCPKQKKTMFQDLPSFPYSCKILSYSIQELYKSMWIFVAPPTR